MRLDTALALALLAANATAADDLARAKKLAHETLIVDTHIDVPYRLEEGWADVTRATGDGEFDYPRATAGGLDVAFMSIYTPPELETEGGSAQLANRLIDSVEALQGRAPEHFAVLRSVRDVERLAKPGRLLLALGMENGSPIEHKLENLKVFRDRGVRYITLAHGQSNHISDSSYDEKRPWDGLSPFGVDVVKRMNALGIMVDVSHLSDAAVRDVLAASDVPVIASHSSARHFTPEWERNLSDELIQAIAAKGGVVQINFGSSFVTKAAHEWSTAESAAKKAFLAANGFSDDGEAAAAWSKKYLERHPFPFATVADVADHFDHVVKLVGIDHVGVGSDFDGVGPTLPIGLKSTADYPNLVAELMKRGYSDADLRKLLGGNLMRVWTAVEKRATE
jgi:membrane dipeptidase